MIHQEFADQMAVANITLDKAVVAMPGNGCQIFRIPRIGEQVEIDHAKSGFDQSFADMRADESRSTRDQNGL